MLFSAGYGSFDGCSSDETGDSGAARSWRGLRTRVKIRVGFVYVSRPFDRTVRRNAGLRCVTGRSSRFGSWSLGGSKTLGSCRGDVELGRISRDWLKLSRVCSDDFRLRRIVRRSSTLRGIVGSGGRLSKVGFRHCWSRNIKRENARGMSCQSAGCFIRKHCEEATAVPQSLSIVLTTWGPPHAHRGPANIGQARDFVCSRSKITYKHINRHEF